MAAGARAIGANSKAEATNAAAMGWDSVASGASSIAIGETSKATADHSIAMSTSANVAAEDAIAIGHNAQVDANQQRSIALGANSKTANVVSTPNQLVNGLWYKNYAGGSADSTLSVGSDTVKRTITNVAAGRVDEVLNTEPTIKDPEQPKDDHDFKGEVKFEGVQFRYGDADADVLHHINFTAKPGETTALIGSTGSGKSTIVNLIPRLFDVTGGRITIDGIDIREMSMHKLHEIMGFVPQKGILFSGDIASNIKFGDADISDEQMKKAASIAQADEFINSNEKGFDRAISQGGTNVSGGQKQRLSIARALAKNPKILIFDDSFSALDNKTDVALRKALAENIKDATQIIVAQKISTILHADNIIVLDEGRVVAQGRHEELMQTSAVYQEIAQSQLSNAELGIEEAD